MPDPFLDPDATFDAVQAAADEAMRTAGLAATYLGLAATYLGRATDHMKVQFDGEANALTRLFSAVRLVDQTQEALHAAIFATLRRDAAEAGTAAQARRRADARAFLEAAVILALDLPDRWTRTTRHDGGTRMVDEIDVVTALRLAPAVIALRGVGPAAAIAFDAFYPGDIGPDGERAYYLESLARAGLTPADAEAPPATPEPAEAPHA